MLVSPGILLGEGSKYLSKLPRTKRRYYIAFITNATSII